MSFSAFLIGTVLASIVVLVGLLAAPMGRRSPAATTGLMALVAAHVDPLPDGIRFGQDDLLD